SATQTGMVMGTPSYMAPEQARGERADHRADVYGVAACLYACLTGRPPHEEESAQQTVVAVMTTEPLRPRSFAPEVPPELEVEIDPDRHGHGHTLLYGARTGEGRARRPPRRRVWRGRVPVCVPHRPAPSRRGIGATDRGRGDDDGAAAPPVVRTRGAARARG